MLSKTGVQILGICKGINSYVGKEKTFWSVDLEVQGTRMFVNVRLPEGFNRSVFNLYELTKLNVRIVPTFDKKGIQLEAIA